MERYSTLKKRIRDAYVDFTDGHIKVANYIQANPEQLLVQSTQEIAQYCEVSKATVSRFIRKLGYETHQELRQELMEVRQKGVPMLTGESCSQGLHTDLMSITRLSEQIELLNISDLACEIATAQRVVIIGFRNSYPVALHFRQQLLQCRNNVVLLPTSGQTLGEELASLTQDDFLVVVGLRRRIGLFPRLMAHLEPYRSLLVSDQSGQKYAHQTNYFLMCQMSNHEPLDSYCAPMAAVSYIANQVYRHLDHQATHQSLTISSIYDELEELE